MEQLLQGKIQPVQKDYYDISDAAQYLGLSKDYMYKLNFRKEIPYYNTGKKVYYKKEDLDAYITRNRVMSQSEIDEKAEAIINNHKIGR